MSSYHELHQTIILVFILEGLAAPKLIKILKAELEASTVPAYTCGHASISTSSAKQKSNVSVREQNSIGVLMSRVMNSCL